MELKPRELKPCTTTSCHNSLWVGNGRPVFATKRQVLKQAVTISDHNCSCRSQIQRCLKLSARIDARELSLHGPSHRKAGRRRLGTCLAGAASHKTLSGFSLYKTEGSLRVHQRKVQINYMSMNWFMIPFNALLLPAAGDPCRWHLAVPFACSSAPTMPRGHSEPGLHLAASPCDVTSRYPSSGRATLADRAGAWLEAASRGRGSCSLFLLFGELDDLLRYRANGIIKSEFKP
jgi:hypothetical protein